MCNNVQMGAGGEFGVRPWGRDQVLANEPDIKVKQIYRSARVKYSEYFGGTTSFASRKIPGDRPMARSASDGGQYTRRMG